MSLSINLLPDLRQAKLRDHRRRQLVTGVSVSIWIACGAVVALLGVYEAAQVGIISVKTAEIKTRETTLTNKAGLIDALTADQHLTSLPALYASRVYMSKFFNAYSQADPVSVSISSLQIDATGALTVVGTAPNFASVAKLARAMTASNVSIGTSALASNSPYFTNVGITSLDNSDKAGVNFTITATLSPGVTSGSN